MKFLIAVVLLVITNHAEAQVASCGGFDSTFVQMSGADFSRDAAGWDSELAVMQSVGVDTIVLQFSGDSGGSYDSRTAGKLPVQSMMDAALVRGMRVWIGLYSDASWTAERLPQPLNDQAGREWLRTLSHHRAFAGWYIPQEIEELTWDRPDREPRIRDFLNRAALELHRLAPAAPIMIAPYYGETKTPDEYALFLARILRDRPVNIVAIQDGKGARSTPDSVVSQIFTLAQARLDALGIGLWSDVELFYQTHGPPRDSLPFAAVPGDAATIRTTMSVIALQSIEHMTSFTVLNYMHPTRSAATKVLYDDYRAGCH